MACTGHKNKRNDRISNSANHDQTARMCVQADHDMHWSQRHTQLPLAPDYLHSYHNINIKQIISI